MIARMNDKTTKFLLFLIALGLWTNILMTVVAHPASVRADGDRIGDIADDIHRVANGICPSKKLCGD